MFKKFILASSILALTTGAALANPAPYLGAGLGIVNNTANISTESNYYNYFYNDNYKYTAGGYRGVPFNLFAGYGGVINQNFYLAGELFGTAGTVNISDSSFLKTTYGYGASIIPGFMLSDHTLAYVRAGVVRSKFQNDDTHTGAQFGLGMQTSLTQNVDLRGEYDFNAYRSINVVDYDVYGWGYSKTSIAPRSDLFTVSLVYKFE